MFGNFDQNFGLPVDAQDGAFDETQLPVGGQPGPAMMPPLDAEEISGGSSLIGKGLGFESADSQALIAAGGAQIESDNQYSSSLTSTFSAIGKMFGATLP